MNGAWNLTSLEWLAAAAILIVWNFYWLAWPKVKPILIKLHEQKIIDDRNMR